MDYTDQVCVRDSGSHCKMMPSSKSVLESFLRISTFETTAQFAFNMLISLGMLSTGSHGITTVNGFIKTQH